MARRRTCLSRLLRSCFLSRTMKTTSTCSFKERWRKMRALARPITWTAGSSPPLQKQSSKSYQLTKEELAVVRTKWRTVVLKRSKTKTSPRR